MLWNGVEVQCDHNGWLSARRCTPDGYVAVQVNVGKDKFRRKLMICFRANGWISWTDVEGMSLAVAYIQFGGPIEPLLDWCLEHVEERLTPTHDAQDKWVRDQLEQMIAAVANTEYTDAEDVL